MGKELYVGNLDGDVKTATLRELFSRFGMVETADAVMKKSTGKCRGFGFVVMRNAEEAQTAITELNETSLLGNTIIVAEAKPSKPRVSNDFGDRHGGRGGNGYERRGGGGGGGYRGGSSSGGGRTQNR